MDPRPKNCKIYVVKMSFQRKMKALKNSLKAFEKQREGQEETLLK